MTCLIFISTLCFICQFMDGQGHLMEYFGSEPGETSDERITAEEKLNGPGKESLELNASEDEMVFQGESEENGANKMDKSQEDSSSGSSSDFNDKVVSLVTESKENDKKTKQLFKETLQRFVSEMAAGDTADLIGQNPHVRQGHLYNDLGRRFVPQYKYNEASNNTEVAEADDNELTPEKAPPELVMLVAKESALLGPDNQMDLGNATERKKILRTGDYWNSVWKEEVNLKATLRSATQKKVLGSIKAKIKPGSEFYKVVSRMKKISPRLLYIINKKQV